MDIEHLNLANLGAGAALEKWGEELQKVAENILDPNTEATGKRELVLKVTIKPSKERREAGIVIAVSSKLAAQIAVQRNVWFGVDNKTGQVVIAEQNTDQLALAFERAQRQQKPLVHNPETGEVADEGDES